MIVKNVTLTIPIFLSDKIVYLYMAGKFEWSWIHDLLFQEFKWYLFDFFLTFSTINLKLSSKFCKPKIEVGDEIVSPTFVNFKILS